MNDFHYNISPEQVVINPASLAKLMGLETNNIPEPYLGLINQEIELIRRYKNIQGGYHIFDKTHIDDHNNVIVIDDILFHPGRHVVRYLKGSQSLALFVCTAGKEISMRSRQLMAEGNLLEGYVADLTGSLLVETAMNWVHDTLRHNMEKKGLKITNRYSPGYCNWDVAEQHLLFTLLPENFCGITLSESALMSPIKSVSGIIGIGKNVRHHQYGCSACPDVGCIFRNPNRA